MADNPRTMIFNFAKDNPGILALQFIIDDPDGVCIEAITESGIINYVYRVQAADRTASVIIKYAEETLRMLPSMRLPLARQELEYNCLRLMQDVEAGSAPHPLCLDKNHNILAMADLSDWELLAPQLERGHVNLTAATHLGRVLGKLCKHTSRGNLTVEQWEEYHRTIHNVELKEIKRALMYDCTLDETNSINYIPESMVESYRAYVKEIRSRRLNKKLNDLFSMEKCLVHSDCHSNSVFVKESHVSLIDFEFSFLGNPTHTIAYPIECYIMYYILYETHGATSQASMSTSAQEFKASCLQAIRNMVLAYLEVEKEIANDAACIATFLSEVTLFTGGFAFQVSLFKEVESFLKVYEDEDRRRMMEIGFKLMREHETVKTVDQFIHTMSFTFGQPC